MKNGLKWDIMEKDLKSLFIRWYFNEFAELDPLHLEMGKIFENSPYHRERNVAVHTNMVVADYLSRTASKNDEKAWVYGDLYGAFACAFHDVGKPAARTEAYKPERGTYYRFGGHELISARLWEDWAVRNWLFLQEEFGLSADAIYRIGWLIENHLPWAVKKDEKLRTMALGAFNIIGTVDTFINVLKADSWGRISDDAEQKKANVNAWCESFINLYNIVVNEYSHSYKNEDAPVLYLPIGASGTGKTTRFNELHKDNSDEILHFSLDTLRHELYDPNDYRNAFALSCEDSQFNNKANKVFINMVKTGKSVYVDNINVSKKRRAYYIREARRYGYNVEAILAPVDLQTVINRQSTRQDKWVPAEAVERQYMSLTLPSLGEVDNVVTYDNNLPKIPA